MRRLLFLMLFALAAWGQPASNTAARNPKYVNANVSAGTTVPASCTSNQIFIKTNATSGSNLYACVSGSFVAQAGGTGGAATFDAIETGTNKSATMTVDSGAAIAHSGSGTIAATTADTATALAANGANCSAGQYPLGVDASGAVESCTAAPTGVSGTEMTQATANDTDNAVPKAVGTSGRAFEKTAVTIGDDNIVTAAGFKTAAGATAGLLGLTQGTACTPGTTEVCLYAPTGVTSYGIVLPAAVGSSGLLHWGVSSTVATLSSSTVVGADFGTKTANYVFAGPTTGSAAAPDFRALVDADIPAGVARLADPVFTGSVQLPNGGPTIDAAGEIGVDTTSDQLQFYGAAKRALPTIHSASFVIMAPAATDDFPIMKAPYGMTILAIHGVLIGSTNVVGQLQECDSAGANCAGLDSDITFNGGDDADDGTLTDSAIAKDAWIAWKTTSVSATPTSLTVTFTYRAVAD